MKFDLTNILVALVSGGGMGIISYLFGRKKNKAETEAIKADVITKQINNLKEITDYWRGYSDELEQRVKEQGVLIKKQREEIEELKRVVEELKSQIGNLKNKSDG